MSIINYKKTVIHDIVLSIITVLLWLQVLRWAGLAHLSAAFFRHACLCGGRCCGGRGVVVAFIALTAVTAAVHHHAESVHVPNLALPSEVTSYTCTSLQINDHSCKTTVKHNAFLWISSKLSWRNAHFK